jgi:hypothetical protein
MTRTLTAGLGRISTSHLWALVVLMAILWVAMGTPLPPLDFWWHLKAGEVIWTTRSIPRVDTFSSTAWGQSFVYQNWLSEVIYHLTYLLGGFPLLVALHALTITLSFALVLRTTWRFTSRPRLAALCALAGEILAIRFTNARPQVLSMLFFSIFYLVLQRYRHRPGHSVWLLIPLMALWANVHGAFVLGLGLVALFAGTELLKAAFAVRDALSRGAIVRLSVILLLLILASLLNPEGWRVYEYAWDVQTDPASQKLVTEWQSPTVRSVRDMPFFVALLVGFLTFVHSTKRDLTDLVLFSVFAALGLASVRGIIWFALILPPVLASQLENVDLAPIRQALGRWQAHRCAEPTPPAHPILNLMLFLMLAGITLVLSPWVRPGLSAPRLRSELVAPGIPRAAMDFIAREEIQGRIYHPQEAGDYLIWRLYPQQRSFVDGRVHLYGEGFCRDYLRILNGCGWQSLLAQYDVMWVLLTQEGGKEELREGLEAASGWQRIYEDDKAILYHRIGYGEDGP